MSFSADNLLGFGGLAIGSIATVAMTKEITGAIKRTSNPPRRKSKPMKLKNKKGTSRYSIQSLSRLG